MVRCFFFIFERSSNHSTILLIMVRYIFLPWHCSRRLWVDFLIKNLQIYLTTSSFFLSMGRESPHRLTKTAKRKDFSDFIFFVNQLVNQTYKLEFYFFKLFSLLKNAFSKIAYSCSEHTSLHFLSYSVERSNIALIFTHGNSLHSLHLLTLCLFVHSTN